MDRCSIKKQKDSRQYPQRPIVGVGAVILRRNSVLLVERSREPLKGYWSLPGGAVEAGEPLEVAIRREVLEETGLEVKPLGVIEIFERITKDAQGRAEYHYVLVDYLCKVTSGKPQSADDASDVRWVPRSALKDYRITEGSVPVIEKGFHARAARSFHLSTTLVR